MRVCVWEFDSFCSATGSQEREREGEKDCVIQSEQLEKEIDRERERARVSERKSAAIVFNFRCY